MKFVEFIGMMCKFVFESSCVMAFFFSGSSVMVFMMFCFVFLMYIL